MNYLLSVFIYRLDDSHEMRTGHIASTANHDGSGIGPTTKKSTAGSGSVKFTASSRFNIHVHDTEQFELHLN